MCVWNGSPAKRAAVDDDEAVCRDGGARFFNDFEVYCFVWVEV